MLNLPQHRQPMWRLTLDGRDISASFRPRLISLNLTDNRSFEADTLDITLDDSDGKLAIPRKGVTLAVQLGWAGEPLIDKGSYMVDEVEHSGSPDQLTLRAKSADLRTGMAEKQERSWAGQRISAIVQSIANAYGLSPRISALLADEIVSHVDQTNESDINLLTRLAREFDAIATVKAGKLLFMPIGEAQSATGIPFPRATITRTDGDRHRFAIAERETYTAVRANYHDTRAAQRGSVTVDAQGARHNVGTPSTESTKVLRHGYASRTNAERAARAEWQRLQRGAASFSLSLAYARPDLFPELPATVKGFKAEIDSASWIITRASHSLSNSGFTTDLELELGL